MAAVTENRTKFFSIVDCSRNKLDILEKGNHCSFALWVLCRAYSPFHMLYLA
jgi:hypothetical protein